MRDDESVRRELLTSSLSARGDTLHARPSVGRESMDVSTSVQAAASWLAARRDSAVDCAIVLVPLLVWAAALWPAVFVADSQDTWNQAARGPVIKWHPPVYTYLQRFAYLTVGSPWLITLLQCLLMAWAIGRIVGLARRAGLSAWLARGVAAGIAALPPVGAFTSQLIKDVLYTVGFLIVISLVAERALARSDRSPAGRGRFSDHVLLWGGLSMMTLMRVNGVVAVAGAVVAAIIVWRPRWAAVTVAGLVLAAATLTTNVVYPLLDVRQAPPFMRDGLYLLDLAAVAQRDPDSLSDATVENMELYVPFEDFRQGYNCHWANQPLQNRLYVAAPVDLAVLREAWLDALVDHPLLLAGNHLCAASPSWNPWPAPEELVYRQTVWTVVVDNPQGVVSDPLWNWLGRKARQVIAWIGFGALSQFLLWRAPTWMYTLGLLLTVLVWRRRRWLPLVVMLPMLTQTLSVIAIAGPHYRYMAPVWIASVLLIPVVVATVRSDRRAAWPAGACDSELHDQSGSDGAALDSQDSEEDPEVADHRSTLGAADTG